MRRKVRVQVADAAGNITLFVLDRFDRTEYAHVAGQLFAIPGIGAEQVAFVTGENSMEMCGLEFCGNASRSFALMIARAAGDAGKATKAPEVGKASEAAEVAKASGCGDVGKATEAPEVAKASGCGDVGKATEAPEVAKAGEGAVVVPVRVSGAEGVLEVEVEPGTGHARIEMPLHKWVKEYKVRLEKQAEGEPAGKTDGAGEAGREAGQEAGQEAGREVGCKAGREVGGMLVDLGGIMHLILEDVEPDDEVFGVLRDRIAVEFDPPAIGVMFMDGDRMTPVVYVKDVDTVYHEGSCASGTTAAVIARSEGGPDGVAGFRIKQPEGVLDASVEVAGGKVSKVWIEGPVVLGEPFETELEV